MEVTWRDGGLKCKVEGVDPNIFFDFADLRNEFSCPPYPPYLPHPPLSKEE
jgi:hypothetical protein